MSDYERIAEAIRYLQRHQAEQPSLEQLAAHLHLSPYHCQRLFTRWAGISPKRFLQIITLELGKRLLLDSRSLLETSEALGLSSSSRLYDHFVQLEAMSPGEYRSDGSDLAISYGSTDTPFGSLFIASTPRGICRAAFTEDGGKAALEELRRQWSRAQFVRQQEQVRVLGEKIFSSHQSAPEEPLVLHVSGTNFQLAVWRALLQIPSGRALSYRDVAAAVGRPGAARATGSAIGANPVAVLIPCHRVILQSGALGGYRWQPERKLALQAFEQLRTTAAEADTGS